MATYLERKGRWMAVIHIKPFPRQGKTFATKEAATAWADEQESLQRMAKRKAKEAGHQPDVSGFCRPLNEILALPRLKPTEMSGVYFLIKEDACIYVGSSYNVHARVKEHMKSEGKTSNLDSYTFISYPMDEMKEAEKRYIKLMKPPLNSTFIERDARISRLVQT